MAKAIVFKPLNNSKTDIYQSSQVTGYARDQTTGELINKFGLNVKTIFEELFGTERQSIDAGGGWTAGNHNLFSLGKVLIDSISINLKSTGTSQAWLLINNKKVFHYRLLLADPTLNQLIVFPRPLLSYANNLVVFVTSGSNVDGDITINYFGNIEGKVNA
jgi:hypothetical protein